MYIAIKDKDSVKIGITMADDNIGTHPHDYTLEDNLPIWKIRGQKGCMVAVSSTCFAANILKINNSLFNFEINDENMFGGFASKLKDYLQVVDIVNSDEKWFSRLIITNGEVIYEVASDFTITKYTDYAISNKWERLVQGAIDKNVNEPIEDRIMSGFNVVDKTNGFNLYPISIYDTKTGKRKLYYSKEEYLNRKKK